MTEVSGLRCIAICLFSFSQQIMPNKMCAVQFYRLILAWNDAICQARLFWFESFACSELNEFLFYLMVRRFDGARSIIRRTLWLWLSINWAMNILFQIRFFYYDSQPAVFDWLSAALAWQSSAWHCSHGFYVLLLVKEVFKWHWKMIRKIRFSQLCMKILLAKFFFRSK